MEEWAQHGVSALKVNENHFILTAEAWHPTWLASGEKGTFADAFSDESVRVDGRCPADPFVADATGYEQYSCPGQREAIRACFLMNPGHTLIVNLPTGSGKSLVGQVPALVHKEAGSLTLFVVPTVALALDQARQMTQYFLRSAPGSRSWPLAWYGGMPPNDRSEVRRRMADGTQRILFTSPEALITSLSRSVFDASEARMLQYLVIDEAHLVTQWGDDFRPAFQALAGLRNALLRHSKFSALRTLLLSATFTADTVATLASLFGPPDRVHMVSAVHLRPEPQYWFYRASSSAEKQDSIVEALRHAPRPFILYLTKREDAINWQRRLKETVGLTRTACFHGETSDQDRRSILQRWVSNDLDGVVATSAFGVGIDKADVRTIIHATIPETLDRFYQEVGRGGRDGRTSVSLVVHDQSEWAVAKSLGRPTIISDELGINRWKALYDSREKADVDDFFEINIDAIPHHGSGANEYNIGWNMRTLLLMVRAGLVELDIRANEDTVAEIREFSPSSPLAAMARIRLRILDHGHHLTNTWERAVGASRNATRHAAQSSLELMERLLLKQDEVGATLASLYRSASQRWPVDVTEVCGGCPADRFNPERPRSYRVPLAVALRDIERPDMSAWKALLPWLDPQFVMVFFDNDLPDRTAGILRLLGWLVRACGLQEIATESGSQLAGMPEVRTLYRRSRRGMLVHRDLSQQNEEPYSPLSRVSILETSDPRPLEDARTLQRPYHVVLLPTTTPDSDNPDRLLVDTVTYGIRLDKLISVLAA
jgi:superfamily II DNA/RNA helicase